MRMCDSHLEKYTIAGGGGAQTWLDRIVISAIVQKWCRKHCKVEPRMDLRLYLGPLPLFDLVWHFVHFIDTSDWGFVPKLKTAPLIGCVIWKIALNLKCLSKNRDLDIYGFLGSWWIVWLCHGCMIGLSGILKFVINHNIFWTELFSDT